MHSRLKQIFTLIVLLWSLGACRTGDMERSVDQSITETREETNAFEIVPGQRVGLVTALSTEYTLREAYGSDNVSMRSVSMGEGVQEEGVVIFPGTNDEVEIVWDIEAAGGHPAFVRITKENTRWRTKGGVTIGMPIWKLEELNGGPFALNGFEWDFAGLVTDWNRGKFNEHLIVVLIPTNFEALDEELMGDIKIFSNDLRLRPLELKVGSMAVTFEGVK